MTRPSRTRFQSNKIRGPKKSVYTAHDIKQFIKEAECKGFERKLPEVTQPKGCCWKVLIKSVSLTVTPAEMRAYKQRWEACKKKWIAEDDPRADQMTPIQIFKKGTLEEQNAEGSYFIINRNTGQK